MSLFQLPRFSKSLIRSIVFIFFLSGCSTAPVRVEIPLAPKTDDKSSSYLEEKLGQAGYYFFVLNFKLTDDVKAVNRLNRVGARLARYTERPHIQYKFFIIDSKYRNAYALPDGYILITNSYVSKLDHDEKLAAVLSHEMAHVTHKHALESYERSKGKKSNPLTAILGEDIVRISTELGYNQTYELQADQTSLRYLYRAGYNPEAAINLLEDFKQIEKEDEIEFKKDQNQPKKSHVLSNRLPATHPHLENRIVNARNYIKQVYETEKVQYNPKDFNF